MRIWLIIVSVAAIFSCGGEKQASLAKGNTSDWTQFDNTPWSAEQAAEAAAAYLLRHLNADGRFDYMRQSDMRESKYNVLRHAGSIYALQQFYAYRPSADLLAGIVRASGYLQRRYVVSLKIRPELRAVISKPSEESLPGPTAKLGGAALVLAALCGTQRLAPSTVSINELQALGNFILFMQREDGSFHSKYREGIGFDTEFHSLYYPGEAMLALTMLYDVDKDPKWLQASLKAAAQLVRSREGMRKIPADHWMMLASVPLLERYDAIPAPTLSREALVAHIERIAKIIIAKQRTDLVAPMQMESGAFEKQARSTPTATRLEGLTAFARIQQSTSGQIAHEIRKAIDAGIAMLRRCQIKRPGQESGGMP
ncbi:MAG: hypothetical protein JKY56_22800, partial [Kofleriaceae bacterium]|nr:hypothetical protein [Kofleriaceae bacterium]